MTMRLDWRVKLVLLVLALIGAFAGGAWGYYLWRFPYGWSDRSDDQLLMALRSYADAHGGAFPSGEATPEASLSLLYPDYADAILLRGKSVPLDVVQARLGRGERLDPESCGWHYVEGLRTDDDGRLALFWDKAGLGHNGERWDDGHYVWFVGLYGEHIPASRWESFLRDQEELLAARAKKRR
jgi:hypothetical protein